MAPKKILVKLKSKKGAKCSFAKKKSLVGLTQCDTFVDPSPLECHVLFEWALRRENLCETVMTKL
jgi:hypothetical protein